jgi:hypothetical protein
LPADAGGVFVRWLEVDLLAAQNCPLDLYLTLSYIAKLTVRNALMTRYVAFYLRESELAEYRFAAPTRGGGALEGTPRFPDRAREPQSNYGTRGAMHWC